MHLAEVDSTQSFLRRRIGQRGELGRPVLVLAQHQTAGRGSWGRSWQDTPGEALLMSLGARLSFKPTPLLSLAACAAVGRGLMRAFPELEERFFFKWPNDLILEDRKVGGTLTEIVRRHAIVGVGINLGCLPSLREPPPLPPTSLTLELGRRVELSAELVVPLVEELLGLVGLGDERAGERIGELVEFFAGREWSQRRELPVTVEGMRVTALVKGVDPETGELILTKGGREIRVMSYQQVLERPSPGDEEGGEG